MPTYLILVLVLLILRYAIETTADLLNVGSMKTTLPAEFQGLYDQQKYQTTLEYQREGHRFSVFARTVSLLLTIGFILLGGFNLVDGFARGFGWGSIGTGLVFAGALLLLCGVTLVPFHPASAQSLARLQSSPHPEAD